MIVSLYNYIQLLTSFVNYSTSGLYPVQFAENKMNSIMQIKSAKHKYALLLMVAVGLTATGAMGLAADSYAQKIDDGMDGYVVGSPDGGAGIYTGNPNECWWDSDGDGVLDMYCLIDTGDTAWMITASSLVLFMTPGVAFLYGGL
ncbi:uncharacterized protein METZ01_LOCUS142389, partial [marine metagenome]